MLFFNLVAISCPVRSILQPPGWVLHARSSSRELACTGAKVKPNIWGFGWVHFFLILNQKAASGALREV